MTQMVLFAPAAKPRPKTKAKRKPPLLRKDVMGLHITVMWAHTRMNAGIGRGDWKSAEGYADELEKALADFEAILPERDLPDGPDEEYREWSAPVREAVTVLRKGVAELKPAPVPNAVLPTKPETRQD